MGGEAARRRASPRVLPQRLERLPLVRLEDGTHALLACDARARLLGFAFMDPPPAGLHLLIPRCRSVHTFGMRFPIDVVFLGPDDSPVRVERGVGPGRILFCRRATAVLERPAAP
jgi:uncharacterized membrane protein (UPF0127 family)